MNAPDDNPAMPSAHWKRMKTMLGLTLVALLFVIIIAAFLLRGGTTTERSTFSGYRYTVVYTIHTSTGNATSRNQMDNTDWTTNFTPGHPFTMTQPFYNNVSGGTTMVSAVTCETPGFTFLNSSLSFPFSVPTALDASTTNNNVMVTLTFSTPSTPYNGPLIYTAYFDYYPPT